MSYAATDLVLCESADGWSLHAPESTDDQIASGDAPAIADGSGAPTYSDYAAAFAAWREQAVTEAAERLDSVWSDGRCVYYDDSMSSYYLCDDEDEMLDLWCLMHHADEDIRGDAYSHWCAGNTHAHVVAPLSAIESK